MTDTVEKGFSGVAIIVRARKGFLELLPERNGDSPSAPKRNSILSAHHIISNKSDFFDSIGQLRSSQPRLRTSVDPPIPQGNAATPKDSAWCQFCREHVQHPCYG